MLRKLVAIASVALLAMPLGCYNTYSVTLDEMSKVQEGGQSSVVKLGTQEGENVDVTMNTKIGVTQTDGTYHEVSPFNFTLTRGQLIAPDEDLLLARESIDHGNIKLVSGTKTALLVAAGVAALLAGGIYIQATAPPREEF